MGTLRQLWLRWKMLRLPWRKQYLIGQDLAGNTYWEMKSALAPTGLASNGASRNRRILRPYAGRATHLSDVQISPQWHQWLRQTRADPPSLAEQEGDLVRRAQLKEGARLADERWAAKGRYIEKPAGQERITDAPVKKDGKATQKDSPRVEAEAKADAKGSDPGSTWQPEAWLPEALRR